MSPPQKGTATAALAASWPPAGSIPRQKVPSELASSDTDHHATRWGAGDTIIMIPCARLMSIAVCELIQLKGGWPVLS